MDMHMHTFCVPLYNISGEACALLYGEEQSF